MKWRILYYRLMMSLFVFFIAFLITGCDKKASQDLHNFTEVGIRCGKNISLLYSSLKNEFEFIADDNLTSMADKMAIASKTSEIEERIKFGKSFESLFERYSKILKNNFSMDYVSTSTLDLRNSVASITEKLDSYSVYFKNEDWYKINQISALENLSKGVASYGSLLEGLVKWIDSRKIERIIRKETIALSAKYDEIFESFYQNELAAAKLHFEACVMHTKSLLLKHVELNDVIIYDENLGKSFEAYGFSKYKPNRCLAKCEIEARLEKELGKKTKEFVSVHVVAVPHDQIFA